jgi:hypothetical protein
MEIAGQTPYIAGALAQARAKGIPTAAIVGASSLASARSADVVLAAQAHLRALASFRLKRSFMPWPRCCACALLTVSPAPSRPSQSYPNASPNTTNNCQEVNMRFVRFQAGSEPAQLGWLHEGAVGVVEGSPFGEFRRLETEYPLDSVRLLAPVQPTKILCIGRNYVAHAQNTMQVPQVTCYFSSPRP